MMQGIPKNKNKNEQLQFYREKVEHKLQVDKPEH